MCPACGTWCWSTLPSICLARRAPTTVPHGIEVDTDRIAMHAFAHGIRSQPTDRLVSGRVIAPDDFSSFFCTGGTTGTPKIAMRRHANEVANAWSVGQVLGDGMAAGKTLFCGLPMFHVNAVLVTGLLPFSRGAHVILGTPQGWRGEGVFARFWEMVERHRINFFSGVPTVYAALLQQPIEGRDVSSLEYGLCGAAPMPLELMRGFQERTGLKILEGYGLTEGTCVSTVNPPQGERRLGSIGLRVPLQAMKAVILDEGGTYVRDCAVGEVGVLVIRGPNVFAGYKVAEHNKGLWVDCRRWRALAEHRRPRSTRRRRLLLPDRPQEGTDHSRRPQHRPCGHRAAAAPASGRAVAAAVGRPDAHAGEVPVAYVQLKPGSETSEADLLTFAGAHRRARCGTQGDSDRTGHAADRRRQDLQAGTEAARDRGCRCQRRYAAPAYPWNRSRLGTIRAKERWLRYRSPMARTHKSPRVF